MAGIDPLADWWVHKVIVERKRGEGAYGPVFADPVQVPCFVDESQRLVRGADGAEIVSSTGVAFPAEVGPIPHGSRITLRPPHTERTALVVTVARADSPFGPNHHEIRLE